jgi:hypothetical protein
MDMTDRRVQDQYDDEYEGAIWDAPDEREMQRRDRFSALSFPADFPLYHPQAGRASLDFLAYEVGGGNPQAEKGKLFWKRNYSVHRLQVPPFGNVLCVADAFGEPCAACAWRNAVWNGPRLGKGHPIWQVYKDLDASKRAVSHLIHLEEADAGVQLFDNSAWTFYRPLTDYIELHGEDSPLRWHYRLTSGRQPGQTGYTVRTQFVDGENWKEVKGFVFTPRADYQREILQHTVCLDDLLVRPNYDEVRDLVEAMAAACGAPQAQAPPPPQSPQRTSVPVTAPPQRQTLPDRQRPGRAAQTVRPQDVGRVPPQVLGGPDFPVAVLPSARSPLAATAGPAAQTPPDRGGDQTFGVEVGTCWWVQLDGVKDRVWFEVTDALMNRDGVVTLELTGSDRGNVRVMKEDELLNRGVPEDESGLPPAGDEDGEGAEPRQPEAPIPHVQNAPRRGAVQQKPPVKEQGKEPTPAPAPAPGNGRGVERSRRRG